MHILKLSIWQGGNRWYAGDIEDLGHGSGSWWYIPQALGVSYEDYIHLLRNTYHADFFPYQADKNVLIFSFKERNDANKFKNFVNKKSRENHFLV